MERIPVSIRAGDPISRVGVAAGLRPRPEVLVVEESQAGQAAVALVVGEAVTEDTLEDLRAAAGTGARLVLVISRIDESELVSVVEQGVVGLVRRSEATPERLVAVVRSAAKGDGAVPADLLGRLLEQVGHVQRQVLRPRGLNFNGLTDREVEVLRLVAEGFDTAEVAVKVAHSQRTVKQILHDVQTRFHLRNRSHAVAYALRNGLI